MIRGVAGLNEDKHLRISADRKLSQRAYFEEYSFIKGQIFEAEGIKTGRWSVGTINTIHMQ
jgi:hypothetical protein